MFTALCHFVHSFCGLLNRFLSNLTVSTAVLFQALHNTDVAVAVFQHILSCK